MASTVAALERAASARSPSSWNMRATWAKYFSRITRDFSSSCSVLAEAIQTASLWEARPVNAVTSPPVARLTEPSS